MTNPSRVRLAQQSVGEVADVDLADARRDTRLLNVVASVAVKPRAGFPRAMQTPAALEALYRLLGNPSVNWQSILAPHVEKTVERAREHDVVLVAHDTTEFAFRGESERGGLGVMPHGNQGFFGHFALALVPGEARTPLGLLGIHAYTRETQEKVSAAKAVVRSRKKPQTDKESDRWRTLAIEAEEQLGEDRRPVHLMDRESDSFALLAAFAERGSRFVIRARHDRLLLEKTHLRETLECVEGKVFRAVRLSRRNNRVRKFSHPARDERDAHLLYRTRTVTISRPEAAQSAQKSLRVNVVHVFEAEPPEGEEAIDWLLLTSEPVDTADAAMRVIDFYRARWAIEEYFKALKTGCAYEKRQLESYHSLLNALALLAPIAWGLLLLRSTARSFPELPASELFSREELSVLKAISVRVNLSAQPSVRDVLLAIAGVGGHLKRNGDPGWQTLAAGYEDFLMALRGWAAAKASR
jgi:hypothetical protein